MNGRKLMISCLLWGVCFPVFAQRVTYVHTDALGSPVVLTDANRNVVERREYEPYGRQLTPAPQDGPGYTGHVYDAATGMVYMQQRYYDPFLQRFLSVDPITAYSSAGIGLFNRYRYAASNPYKFIDPDGRTERCPGSTNRFCSSSIQVNDASGLTGSGSTAQRNRSRASGSGEYVVDSYNDLPKLPEGVAADDETWSGEGWKRVHRLVGQSIRWYEPGEGDGRKLRLKLLVTLFVKNRTLSNVIVPDIQVAQKKGHRLLEFQIGYQHVFVHKENGVYENPREIYTGYGTIWTRQSEFIVDPTQEHSKPWIGVDF